MFADQLETSTTHRAFNHHMCQCPRGEEDLTIAWVEWDIWTGNVSEMEECKGKKKWLFRRIACSARTSKLTHYIRTAFLKVWCIWRIRTRSSVTFLQFNCRSTSCEVRKITEAHFARWKPGRRTLLSTCSCDGNIARMLLAAFFLSLCCFHYPAGSAMPQTTAYNQKFSCAPPRLDQPYSKALQGLLDFFQHQREQTLVTLCCWDFLGHLQSESVHFLALPTYYFWLLKNSVLFVFARQLALNAARIPWAHHLPWS